MNEFENIIVTVCFRVSTCLFFVWAALALTFLVHKILLYRNFIRSIKTNNTKISDINILNLVSDCKEKLTVKTKVELHHNTLDTSHQEYDTDSIEITLEDHTTIPVSFGNLFFGDTESNAKDYLNDSNAISAIGKLIHSLKTSPIPNAPALEAPCITNITYAGENIAAFAEKSFEDGILVSFSAIFPVLDADLQKKYCQAMYDDGKIAFFSSIIPYMDRDSLMLYATLADHDMKLSFFCYRSLSTAR